MLAHTDRALFESMQTLYYKPLRIRLYARAQSFARTTMAVGPPTDHQKQLHTRRVAECVAEQGTDDGTWLNPRQHV